MTADVVALSSQTEFTEGTTALYRLFDAEGCLLYVGIASNPRGRFAGHARHQPWWPQVARKTLQWHETRELADAAETVAIAMETPRYNIAKVPGPLRLTNQKAPPELPAPVTPDELARRDRLIAAIAQLLAEIRNCDDEITAFWHADALVHFLRAEMVKSATYRAEVATRIRDERGLSLAQLGNAMGFSKARAQEMVGKVKERQRRAAEAAAG